MAKKIDTSEILKKHQTKAGDTGSAQSQIALLTHRLNYLGEHLKDNKKDHSSRRGLLKIVGRRRKLLNYLLKKDSSAYKKLITDLNIRISKSSN